MVEGLPHKQEAMAIITNAFQAQGIEVPDGFNHESLEGALQQPLEDTDAHRQALYHIFEAIHARPAQRDEEDQTGRLHAASRAPSLRQRGCAACQPSACGTS